jgi:protein tyrosine phosphatase
LELEKHENSVTRDQKKERSPIYLCHDSFPGPMDNTVCDFWRMVWEQHLELILMLTNLEEYSKTKCAKYWPDEAEGDKIFGDFGVAHVREKRYSGLLVKMKGTVLVCYLVLQH